jgi:hypothetical protein
MNIPPGLQLMAHEMSQRRSQFCLSFSALQHNQVEPFDSTK